MKYTPEEREAMLAKMTTASNAFYRMATDTGCHAFIEFTGLMNEYIKVCRDAHQQGIDFPFANTHSDEVLPMKPHHLTYLAEKLDCIYGPALATPENRDAFLKALAVPAP